MRLIVHRLEHRRMKYSMTLSHMHFVIEVVDESDLGARLVFGGEVDEARRSVSTGGPSRCGRGAPDGRGVRRRYRSGRTLYAGAERVEADGSG